ncbi:MAG: excinuclease ABC subunit UvrA [Oscillospiraceae bacterium]|nr:excinuclease ABC subunit UvrA [Oscillospiraceae bacterium]
MAADKLIIKGAREHNLKNINVEIPRDKLVVMTGPSGSGKSSLAFDTIYADGQRRYVESLSSYARQFLGQMDKPEVDSIEGLSPAISIDQKTTSKNPRSTVGTVTEIYDYLRLLYARIGIPHCPVCGREIKQQSVDEIVDRLKTMDEGTRLQILAPIVRRRKGEHRKELESAAKAGFVRVRIDGSMYDLAEEINLDKNKKHDIEIVVDRLVIKEGISSRLTDSVETALRAADGLLIALTDEGETLFSQHYSCPEHDVSIEELSPRMFSFNNPMGACEKCTGLGNFLEVSPDLIVPNKKLSINEGAIKASGWSVWEHSTIAAMYFDALAKHFDFSLDTPFEKLPKKIVDILMYGTSEQFEMVRRSEYGSGRYKTTFEGIANNLNRRFRETSSDWVRNDIQRSMTEIPCDKCGGRRLKPLSLGVTVGGLNIMELCELSIGEAIDFIKNLILTEREKLIGERILKEISDRLEFLNNVGLSYLTLSRAAASLSGGESQRIRLATQIGSSLVGVLYILDEPSIGLHQRDNVKLIQTLKNLRDIGNTVIVVEHDEDTIRSADYVVDIGPKAGVHGGEVIYAGDVEGLKKCEASLTGDFLSGRKKIEVPKERRKATDRWLTVKGARENNLKDVTASFPIGLITCVTGVSGSGKSSLVNEIIYKKLAAELNRAHTVAGRHDEITGVEHLDKIIAITQSPIGRTPRSNPATYTGVFDDIRALFASTPDAKRRGYSSGRFSFNVKGGRCEACSGDGILKIEMHFLPDVFVPCEVCKGRRYNRETLEVKYKDKSIADVLDMTVEDALNFFANVPKIKNKLQTLYDVGLSYVTLGQPATTLSGGEAQRVKIASELLKKSTGKTLYILDEPTTGLHPSDVKVLIEVINRLAEGGNTVIIIEHNLDVIKTADYIIDLGPEGGSGGGEIVAEGTPEEVAKVKGSYTGQFIAPLLKD